MEFSSLGSKNMKRTALEDFIVQDMYKISLLKYNGNDRAIQIEAQRRAT